ncbi:MAG: hypothetical protein AAF599_12525 [Bacteroidota bacterium]
MKVVYLDDRVYNELLNVLNNQHFTNRVGQEKDFNFLSDDEWLKDTAVIENVVKRDGMWEIQLIFAHYQAPQKFIKRVISRFSSKHKAELSAFYMRRLAAKDQRGTLTVRILDFNLCSS